MSESGAGVTSQRGSMDLVLVTVAAMVVAACEVGRWSLVISTAAFEWVGLAGSVMALALAGFGGLVVLRGHSRAYGWLMVALGVALSSEAVADAYVAFAWVVRPGGDWPFAMAAAWYQDTWMVSWLLGFLLLPALFPDGRPASPGWGRAVRWSVVAWLVVIVAFMTQHRPLEGFFDGNAAVADPPMNPTGVWGIPGADAGDVIGLPWVLVTVASTVVGIGSLVTRWRRAGDEGRHQIGLVLAALGLLLVALGVEMVEVVFVEVIGVDPGLGWLAELLFTVASVAWVVTLGLAVLRHRLYDVDLVVNRSLVYAVLTLGVLVIYSATVVGVGAVLPGSSDAGLAVGVTVLVAVAFDPARRRVQAGVNRVIYGQRDEPYVLLSRMGEVLAATGTPGQTLQTLVDTVATSLKLPWVAIELDVRNGQVFRAEHGTRDADGPDPLSLPLVHGNESVGWLLVAPRSSREGLDRADRQVLADVARQGGAAAASVRLTLDLQRSREELVLAREEERRRIRRDLHDGLGPSLAAQTLALDAAVECIQDDPSGATEMLVSLKGETQDLVAEVRRLVHELRPPALDELGLAGALVAHVARVDGAGNVAVRVMVDPDPLPELSAAVEVAAYRIAREALTNVLRHAKAGSCTITVSATGPRLQVRIVDDGIGLPVVPRPGVGLRSMRERAEELGGSFSATDGPGGGAEVVATLPRGVAEHGVAVADVEVVHG